MGSIGTVSVRGFPGLVLACLLPPAASGQLPAFHVDTLGIIAFEFSGQCVVVRDYDKVQAGPNRSIRDVVVRTMPIGGRRVHMQIADVLTHSTPRVIDPSQIEGPKHIMATHRLE